MKPRIALIPGDPSGIGPELVAKLLADREVCEHAEVLLIGDEQVFELGQQQAGATFALQRCDAAHDDWAALAAYAWHPTDTLAMDEIEVATVSEASGRCVLRTLDTALDFWGRGIIDAIVFAPFNKAAMHLAGLGCDDELHYMAGKLNVNNYITELNTLDGLWTSRVTSHIPLREVAETITGERIAEAIDLIDTVLKRSGVSRPRISVAALNPHAGDGGKFGREEIDVIAPAIAAAAERQIAADGPWPSDTVFLRAKAGKVDGIVTMYHDQGQIALKLTGFDRGVSVQGGLPLPVTTPAHGTAFDIAGQGVANVRATRAAFDLACNMVRYWHPAPAPMSHSIQ
ncbi:MAG: 4-hydroxythreonine-4-phosphate dehydrogenase PdxA [Gammaproteobacteria bacterium]|nr:4-hydroxythreonine-4-phosphate dehydrogenase PdxA [Gammaproteobacteria bacterium]MDX2460259.1 4-hydroxythreonine-4-phosphate dehydrogenase PdxA [Gammaproteobacteria bacterium]